MEEGERDDGPSEGGESPALDVQGVRQAVEAVAVRTPLLPAPLLSERLGREVLIKPENLQVTGSFKVRGAAARIAALTEEERGAGVVACSSGNHGRAVAHVAGRSGIPATICVPGWVDPVKRRAMEAAGARVVLAGATYDEAAREAERIRDDEGAVFVHPFDDLRVAAGQGTLGLEIVEEAPEAAAVVVPLSGGGLAGGVAYAVKERRPQAVIVAVSARRARVMVESLRAGEPVEMDEEETLANALAGGIDLQNRYTFRLVRELVDRHVLVPEAGIREAMLRAATDLHLIVEGGGAVGLAALLGDWLPAIPEEAGPGPVILILSGGNVGLETLAELESERL